jgi:hypothetical protein
MLGGGDWEGCPYAVIYLSPRDYHRVHMPCDARLTGLRYVPGDLFSVNAVTAASVPALFARNERLVCRFETAHGPMAMVLVATAIGESLRWGGAGSLPTSLMGTMMLSAFHCGLMVFFFFACPMATADTLARERREGTLGLLFLTSLTTTQVVLGKTAASVVRALALWVAVVPFLAIPFLLGGVTLADFARTLAAETAMVSTGLAAGFLGTSRATSWMGAIGAAAVWMIALAVVQGLLCVLGVVAVAQDGFDKVQVRHHRGRHQVSVYMYII